MGGVTEDEREDVLSDFALISLANLAIHRAGGSVLTTMYEGDGKPGVIDAEIVRAVADFADDYRKLVAAGVEGHPTRSKIEYLAECFRLRMLIDPLWRVVETHGVSALLEQVERRKPRPRPRLSDPEA